MIHGLTGSARYELVARSSQGFDEGLVAKVGEMEGVQVAAPVLRENVTLSAGHGQQAVQLIGVTPSIEALGGVATQELGAATVLLKGGLGLPSGVASALDAQPGQALRLASGGVVHSARMRVLLGGSVAGASASPVAVAVLGVAQGMVGMRARVSGILIRPAPGAQRDGVRRACALGGNGTPRPAPGRRRTALAERGDRPRTASPPRCSRRSR